MQKKQRNIHIQEYQNKIVKQQCNHHNNKKYKIQNLQQIQRRKFLPPFGPGSFVSQFAIHRFKD